MEPITITINFYCDHPQKTISGPRSLVEMEFFNYVEDNKELWEDAYIKVKYNGLAAISHNKLPLYALNECYKTLFLYGPPEEKERPDIDDLEVSEDPIINEEDNTSEEITHESIDEEDIPNDRRVNGEIILNDKWEGNEDD